MEGKKDSQRKVKNRASGRAAWFTVERRKYGRKENYIMACHSVHK
jgi:hypothetical protein